MVTAVTSIQSGPVTYVRNDHDASSSTIQIAIVENENERLRKIIAEYESTRKGMFMFLYNGLISK